jgi:hypothetical protein
MKSKVGVWGQEKAAPITRDSILLVGKKVSEVVLTVSEWTADAAYKAIHKASGMLIKEPVVEAVVEAVEINI